MQIAYMDLMNGELHQIFRVSKILQFNMSSDKIDLRDWVRLRSCERKVYKDAVFSFKPKPRPEKGILKKSGEKMTMTDLMPKPAADKVVPAAAEAVSDPPVDLREQLKIKRAKAAAEAAAKEPPVDLREKLRVKRSAATSKLDAPPGFARMRPMKAEVPARDDGALARESRILLKKIIECRKRQLAAMERGELPVQKKPNPFKREWVLPKKRVLQK